MSKIIVAPLLALDGVVEAPGGEPGHPHTGWAGDFMGEEEVAYKFGEVQEAEALLIGRVTYESFAGAWPAYEGEFANRMNSMPKYVVSNTLRDPEWTNTTVISGDVMGQIRQLVAGDRGPLMVHGSRKLAQSLMEYDLVDELRLMIFPVAVGSGFRLFPESPNKVSYRLKGSRSFASGVVEQTYERG